MGRSVPVKALAQVPIVLLVQPPIPLLPLVTLFAENYVVVTNISCDGTLDEVEKLWNDFIAKSKLIIRQNMLIETGKRGGHRECLFSVDTVWLLDYGHFFFGRFCAAPRHHFR